MLRSTRYPRGKVSELCNGFPMQRCGSEVRQNGWMLLHIARAVQLGRRGDVASSISAGALPCRAHFGILSVAHMKASWSLPPLLPSSAPT